MSARRELIYVALAAAEACWLAPLLLALSQRTSPHPPLLLWLGVAVLLLGFSYVYRALLAANLSPRLQQGLLAAALLAIVLFFWRFHLNSSSGATALSWLVEPFRRLVDELDVMPGEWVVATVLPLLWVRGILLARRSLSVKSVGFGFRLGVVLLIGVALAARLLSAPDASGFVVAYFFFALVAVALARVEQVSNLPSSSPVGFSGFWIGSTVVAVGGLVLLSMAVAVFFSGDGLRQVLRWLQPVWLALGFVLAALGALVLFLAEWLLGLFAIDISDIGLGFRDALRRLGELFVAGAPPPQAPEPFRPPILAATQVALTVGVPLLIVLIVALVTWQRLRRNRRDRAGDTHESLLSARAVARNLLDLLRSGRDRLGDLAGLVDRFGVGQRFLSAVSIRRIYANLLRLATRAGYPRTATQTPFEYLETLYEALPGSEADVQRITQAYVDAHYGRVPDTREELQRIRDCWERVRTAKG